MPFPRFVDTKCQFACCERLFRPRRALSTICNPQIGGFDHENEFFNQDHFVGRKNLGKVYTAHFGGLWTIDDVNRLFFYLAYDSALRETFQ